MENHIDILNSDALISENTYFKDVNHLLDKYVGTWVGTYDNKTYKFQLEEITYHSDIRPPLKIDKLLMRYKITDINGNVIKSTMNLPDSTYIIEGRYFSTNEANYIMNYSSIEECEPSGEIYINMVKNETQMNLVLLPNLEYYGCPNGLKESIFPVAGEGYVELMKK